MTTLFCNLLEINWFIVTNFHNQGVDILENKILLETFIDKDVLDHGKKYLRRRGSHDPQEISREQIKVGLHYTCIHVHECKDVL